MSAWGIVASLAVGVIAAVLLVRHLRREHRDTKSEFRDMTEPYRHDKGNGDQNSGR